MVVLCKELRDLEAIEIGDFAKGPSLGEPKQLNLVLSTVFILGGIHFCDTSELAPDVFSHVPFLKFSFISCNPAHHISNFLEIENWIIRSYQEIRKSEIGKSENPKIGKS